MRLTKLTFLAFQLNYLLDRGYYDFSVKEAKAKIRDKSLFGHLKKMSRDDYLDLSLLDDEDRKELLENFEDMAKPNKGEKIQGNSPILAEILNEISKDDKIYKSILVKCQNVIASTSEDKKQTVAIFGKLSDQEKQYCRSRGYLQDGPSGEFAVTFNFLRASKEHLVYEKENDEGSEKNTVNKNKSIGDYCNSN